MRLKTAIYGAILISLLLSSQTYAGFYVVAKKQTGAHIGHPNRAQNNLFSESKISHLCSRYFKMDFPDNEGNKKAEKTRWQGSASLVLGIAGLILWPLGIGALIFGILGLNKKKHYNTGLAIAGIILGSIGTLFLIFFLLILLL